MARTRSLFFLPTRLQQGLSLIEILMILAIMGFLSLQAIPALAQFLSKNQQTSILNTFLNQHYLARTWAIKHHQHVILCKSANAHHCTASSQWQEGWLIFIDQNNNKQVDPNETIVHQQNHLNTHLTLSYQGFASYHYIRYYPDGRTASNGTFSVCDPKDQLVSKAVIISRTGRARINNKKYNGSPITCS